MKNSIIKSINFLKVHTGIMFAIRLILIIALVASLFYKDWIVLFVSSLALLLTFSVSFLEKRYSIKIPIEFELALVLFIFASLFLGEVRGYYTKFWWWDLVLHSGFAIAVSLIGFIILYGLYESKKIGQSPFIVALFTFFFALGTGALWEIMSCTRWTV